MRMRLLVSGCSFTASRWWVMPLVNNGVIKNLAVPAAGNKYIANSIIAEDIDSYDFVIVMWSGITRLDALVEDVSYYDNYPYKKTIDKKSGYICGGQRLGGWKDDAKYYSLVGPLFEEQFKTMSDENLATLSLLEIIKLQNFLKVNNKKYIFCTYINYWNQTKDWIPRGGDFGVNTIPGLTKYVNQIDFSNWVFSDSNKNGYYEIAKEHEFFEKDGWHPNIRAGLLWGEIVSKRIKEMI